MVNIVLLQTKTHVRNGSVGETQTIGNSSFIPGNEESNINNNSDSESYSCKIRINITLLSYHMIIVIRLCPIYLKSNGLQYTYYMYTFVPLSLRRSE